MPEQLPAMRCVAIVWWFDIDITARCVLHHQHPGPHRDGIRWFDSSGFQVTGDEPRPNRKANQ